MPTFKKVHFLLSRTSDYVTLADKRNFVDVIKIKDLGIGRLF